VDVHGHASRTSVFFNARDTWACGWYRCYVPGVALKRLGYRVTLDAQLGAADIASHDVIVFQQPSSPAHLAAIRSANEQGKLTVVEFDDDVWSLSSANPAHAQWNRPDVRSAVQSCVSEAQLVTVPTHALAERMRAMNPAVRVLPNMLPAEGWDIEREARPGDGLVMGWAGSQSHGGDFGVIDGIVQPLLERYPHLQMVIVGGPAAIELAPHERITRVPATDIEHYPQRLALFDIGLIPLADTTFNRSKSDLKFVEYGRLGIPTVASKLEPYLKTVKPAENGFLAKSPNDWLKHLTRLIEDEPLRRTLGSAAQDYARTRVIDAAIDRWERAYGLMRPAAATR